MKQIESRDMDPITIGVPKSVKTQAATSVSSLFGFVEWAIFETAIFISMAE